MTSFRRHRILWSVFTLKVLILGAYLLTLNNYEMMNSRNTIQFDGVFAIGANDSTWIESHQTAAGQCPDVLSGMMIGKWKTRPLTKKEHDEIFAFLFHAHSRYSFPSNYQRNDSLCGNVTYLKSKNYRALCDPKGKTPCCFHNKCVLKTAAECECEDCYDMRNMKHAEYSTWIPSNPGCKYHEHTPQEACDILDGMKVAFVGDSLVRHVYTAMLLVVTGNMKDGAMNPRAANGSKKLCQGMNMFTEKMCRFLLKKTMVACGGKVKLSNNYYISSGYGKAMSRVARNYSFIFTGIGLHDNFNHKKVQEVFLKPTLKFLNASKEKAPKLLWMSNHAAGILKSPIYMLQTNKMVKRFNKIMESFLKPLNIPIFDTYGLTEGMMSFDGAHYGMGINIAKANLFLSYIKEQKAKNAL